MPKRAKAVPRPSGLSPIDEERTFWRRHRDELTAKYPDQFVAVRRATGQVVTVAPSLSAALRDAKRAGFEQTEIWCSKMLTEPVHLIV